MLTAHMVVAEHKMVDVRGPKAVDIQISTDKKTIWINIDGICFFRCTHIELLMLNGRTQTRKG